MDKKLLNAHLAIFIANVFFGLNNPISRSLMPEIIDPITLTYFRMIGGTVLFWLSSLFIKREKVPAKDLRSRVCNRHPRRPTLGVLLTPKAKKSADRLL